MLGYVTSEVSWADAHDAPVAEDGERAGCDSPLDGSPRDAKLLRCLVDGEQGPAAPGPMSGHIG